MAQCTVSVADQPTGEVSMQVVRTCTRTMARVARKPPPELSRAAKTRLAWMDHYARHGNVSFTCRHFGISRETFYVWKRRYDPQHLRTLEARSARPHHTRPRTWTTEQVQAVQQLREEWPCWGKDKLQLLLPSELELSVSKVGRILSSLRARGQLIEPPRRITTRQPQAPRPYAQRKPKDYQPTAPGELVEIDTLDVRPQAGTVLKQFTATDVISRHGALELASAATATLATRILEALARLPFPVQAVQIDGGSEFKGAFEAACEQRGLPLFLLPPRSPKLNGHVERSQRTHTEEFYQCTTAAPTLAALRPALAEWETVYNTIRPHQALAYLTPRQFWEAYQRDPTAALAALPQNQPRKERVSGT
jgi:putative transposase